MIADKIPIQVVPCILCGSSDSEHLNALAFEPRGWTATELVHAVCRSCSQVYMRRRPTDAWLAAYYSHDFWEGRVAEHHGIFERQSASLARQLNDEATKFIEGQVTGQRERANRMWNFIAPAMSNLNQESVVIEAGAAFGEALALIRRHTGCNVLAIEPSAFARTHMWRQHGIESGADSLESLLVNGTDATCDLFVLSHVLENTTDPIGILEAIKCRLRPSGRVFVETPNLFYHLSAINPYHCAIFSPDTIRAALNRAGFRIVLEKSTPNPAVSSDKIDKQNAPYIRLLAEVGDQAPSYPQAPTAEIKDLVDQGYRLMRRKSPVERLEDVTRRMRRRIRKLRLRRVSA